LRTAYVVLSFNLISIASLSACILSFHSPNDCISHGHELSLETLRFTRNSYYMKSKYSSLISIFCMRSQTLNLFVLCSPEKLETESLILFREKTEDVRTHDWPPSGRTSSFPLLLSSISLFHFTSVVYFT